MKKNLSDNLSPRAPQALKDTAHRTPFRGGVSVANVFILFLFIFSALHSFSQNPLVKMWDKRFGGTGTDELFRFQQTKDGGFILGGYSQSGIGGDKTDSLRGGAGDLDYWIVKTDSFGNKEWDKDFGGTSDDKFNSLQQTTDGGYILGGGSLSGISGDKTQANWDASLHTADYWIVKTDSLGNKEWDKDIGGTGYDELFSLQQTADGGYILGGTSGSGIGGDKTDSLRGGTFDLDYWIIKTDSLGNKQWDKDFGGTGGDDFFSLQQTADGGYILGGYSQSGIGGDKSDSLRGGGVDVDYWIVKTDWLGNKQWDKDFGGTGYDELYSLKQTADGGYILGGYSRSGIGGDKSDSLRGGAGDIDYWIVKTDSLGNKQWDKDFGGTGVDESFSLKQTTDGGYLLAGYSESPISGDKTENNLGTWQTWVVKTDSLCIKQWDKTILSPGQDETGYAIQTKDGCYAIANMDDGGIGGYKTQASQGSWDYWLIKFCDSTLATSISEIPNENIFSVYPNPVADKLVVKSSELEEREVDITIYNLVGEKVLAVSPLSLGRGVGGEADVSTLPSGMYYLEVTSGSKVFRRKFVKQ